MSKYKLIAFDMDGTLLDTKKQLPQANVDAINKAAAAGATIALCTGRCVSELDPYMDRLSAVKYIVAVGGSLVYGVEDSSRIAEDTLPVETVLQILDAVEDADIMVQYHSLDSIVLTEKVPQMDRYNVGHFRKLFDEIAVTCEDMRAYLLEKQIPIYKINLHFTNHADRVKYREKLSSLNIALVFSEITTLECCPPGVLKSTGMRRLCEHIGVDMADVIGVGDGENDIDMIEAVGFGIAMGNAKDVVKQAADAVVSDNDHGGCVEAVEKYLL